jgi:hypothetical protein
MTTYSALPDPAARSWWRWLLLGAAATAVSGRAGAASLRLSPLCPSSPVCGTVVCRPAARMQQHSSPASRWVHLPQHSRLGRRPPPASSWLA